MRVEPVPAGDESFAFFGPGRNQLDFQALPPIPFDAGGWQVSDPGGSWLTAVRDVLASGKRVVLVGVGDDGVPWEHGRQQGLARALAVRSAVAGLGAEAASIFVAGVASEEDAGITGRSGTGPRVEAVVVR